MGFSLPTAEYAASNFVSFKPAVSCRRNASLKAQRRVGAERTREQRGLGSGSFHFLPPKLCADKMAFNLFAAGIEQRITPIFWRGGEANLGDAIRGVEGVLQS